MFGFGAFGKRLFAWEVWPWGSQALSPVPGALWEAESVRAKVAAESRIGIGLGKEENPGVAGVGHNTGGVQISRRDAFQLFRRRIPRDKDLLRARAVDQWTNVVVSDKQRVGYAGFCADCPENEVRESVEDAIAKGQPTTALAHYRALANYMAWAAAMGEVALPITEAGLWRYLRSLEQTRAPPTKPEAVKKACNYAIHVIIFLATAISFRAASTAS